MLIFCYVYIVLSMCTRYACKEMAKGTRPFDKQMVFEAICQLQPMVVHHQLSVVNCRTFREAVTAEERVHKIGRASCRERVSSPV